MEREETAGGDTCFEEEEEEKNHDDSRVLNTKKKKRWVSVISPTDGGKLEQQPPEASFHGSVHRPIASVTAWRRLFPTVFC
ncbi:hypothetical protein L484_012916 [Morus notabilis]|uniref:Uncharacterized protein n=1 Tax=Morus notabilis TaxID=981085 RepID=W9RDC4_9ROSA|nr:hypothetical protein L484_012916 [Morus notabilis]